MSVITYGHGERGYSPVTFGYGKESESIPLPDYYSISGRELLPISMETRSPVTIQLTEDDTPSGHLTSVVIAVVNRRILAGTSFDFVMQVPLEYGINQYARKILYGIPADKNGRARGRVRFNFRIPSSKLYNARQGYVYVWAQNDNYITPKLKISYVVRS
jgi:hypothetical protein